MKEKTSKKILSRDLALVFVVLSIIFLLTFLIVKEVSSEQQFSPEVKSVSSTISYINYYVKTDYDHSLEEIYDTIKNVSKSHEYKLNVFDCTDFSKEAVDKLKQLGYNTWCVAGNNKYFDYPNHTWVKLQYGDEEMQIEATSGDFIDNPEQQGYTIWKEDYCW